VHAVLLTEIPPPLETWLERHRALGQDLFDEMWEGVYHVSPAFHPAHARLDHRLARFLGPLADAAGLLGCGPLNIGTSDDYRVPDQAYLATEPVTTFVPTAAVVVEIRSPRDETWEKLGFYADRGVREMLVVVREERTVHCFVLWEGRLVETDRSELLGVSATEFTSELGWPAGA
jgi:Uma2 family endonuclease